MNDPIAPTRMVAVIGDEMRRVLDEVQVLAEAGDWRAARYRSKRLYDISALFHNTVTSVLEENRA